MIHLTRTTLQIVKSRSPSTSPSIYKGRRLRDQQNRNVCVADFVVQDECANFSKFFHHNEGLFGRPTCIAANAYFVAVGTESSAVLFYTNVIK